MKSRSRYARLIRFARFARFARLAGPAVLALAVFAAAIGPVRAAWAGEIVVSAAASLTDALAKVKTAFEKENPGTTVVTNFGASGTLLKQMEQGAPVDVFASADETTMDLAKLKKLIDPDSRVDFAANSLVLIVPVESKIPVSGPEALAGPGVARIAVGNPNLVPVGRYAVESFAASGLLESLRPKFIDGESVRQVLDYCVRGEVDAAVVFATDALAAKDKVRVAAVLTGPAPITYPVAIAAGSGNKEAAASFLRYLTSAPGQEILAGYGFKKAAGN
ncbi:MAG: molybdate ABC transporter substrate-binding protein [Desulfovibrionaceae bacterium]|nr:molybdate ABC transporter substrate-binding protein [Desulfovibrionaceae bacterium]MBF0512829.1 molybdate ABC transporter substrate-binding protein [Desulfovibrionaceae bacterium]